MQHYEISKMLTISTAHIPEKLERELELYCQEGIDSNGKLSFLSVYPKSEYGWVIYVPEYCSIDFEAALPKELIPPIRLAKKLDCDWLCFDCDGEVLDELPKYSW